MANKLVLKRHKIATKIFAPFIKAIYKNKYQIDVDKFDNPDHRQYLIMMNHQTGGDQFFIGMAFKDPVYYIATEDIFSNGFSSSLIKFLVGPIPIKKNATDLRAIKNSMRVVKEGGSIAIAPEGNRTFSGVTCNMKPAISKFAKALKVPIAFFKIEGGYGIQPRWSDVIRKGHMHAGVSRVLEPEEYMAMSDEELYDTIVRELYVDESYDGKEFYHKNNAEFIERFIYNCPICGLSEFESNGTILKCKNCGKEIEYMPDKTLKPVSGDFKFKTLKEWYDYQEDYINHLDLAKFGSDDLIYQDTVNFFKVILYKRKVPIDKQAVIKLYKDRIEVEIKGDLIILNFDDCEALSVLGKNKLNIYYKDSIYQIKGSKRFNPIKYMHFYFRYMNLKKGENNDKFLGL